MYQPIQLVVIASSLLLYAAGAEAIAGTYTTNFPLIENPISEDGHWINGLTNGIDWSDVATIPGKAFGTQTGIGPNFADSTALVTGSWGPTQTVQAVVYISSPDSTTFEEVELRLRSSLSAHSCTGYEVLYSVKPGDPYCQIVRWNGSFGDFTLLDARSVGVVDGDVVKATIVGSTITCYINGTVIFSVTDSTYSSGNPGMGFYLQGGLGPPFNYGFSSYTASDNTPTVPPVAHPATLVASNSFTANWGSVSGAIGYRLDVSTSSSFNSYVAGYQNLNVGNATIRSVTGLNASTTYYYRLRAYNGRGTSGNSNVVNVTTLSPTGAPVVTTNPATLIASFSARLNGTVNPHGLTTTVYFRWGPTTSYGLTTPIQSKSGNTYQNISANISGLTANTTYHFRIVATNAAGTRFGVDRTFTTLTVTGPPVVTTNPATNVTNSLARLNGTVNPHGLSTTVYFRYGRTTSYGSRTPNQTKAGNNYKNVFANISGLTAHTTYHFRTVASNTAGTRLGGDRTFTTP